MKYATLLFILIMSFSSSVFAAVWGELSGFYNTDSFFASNDATTTQTFYSLDLYANLNSNASWYAGFHVHQLATTLDTSGGEQNSFSTLDMGPMVMWVMDRKRIYSLTAIYNVVSKATNDDGSQSADWDGSSYMVSFGITPEIADGWYVGFKINYYSASYSEETVNSTVNDVSHTRSMVFPSLVISYRK